MVVLLALLELARLLIGTETDKALLRWLVKEPADFRRWVVMFPNGLQT